MCEPRVYVSVQEKMFQFDKALGTKNTQQQIHDINFVLDT